MIFAVIGAHLLIASHAATALSADFNNDGAVNSLDLSILAANYGKTNATFVMGDANGDGVINIYDLSILASEWGQISTVVGCTNSGFVAPCIGSTTTGASGWGSPVFDDEFSGSKLDTSKWASSWFNGSTMNNVSTSPSNVSVSGGNLILTLSSASVGALVSTNPDDRVKPGFQFGIGCYVEARIFFPGSGTTVYNWPAFWTDGQNWPNDGEIDIAEGLGTLTSNYHSSSGANNSNTIAGSWSNGWHTYGVDRENGINYIYWDGQLVRQYNTNDAGAPHYLIINVGAGHTAAYGATSQVKVDYVRVWQRKS